MQPAAGQRSLTILQATAMLVGIVVGIGIFKTPGLVAQSAASGEMVVLLWLAGGLVMLIGGLCYAELGSAYPHSGGEVYFLTRAYGPGTGFLFAWARMTVIQTGAIAGVGFVFGDYANLVLPLGSHGAALYAALSVIVLTLLQMRGTAMSGLAQSVLTSATVAAIVLVCAIGFAQPSAAAAASPSSASLAPGLAMVFILLTYGGWNEAAYLSGEVRDTRRAMLTVLLLGTLIVTALYLLVNVALLSALGLEGLRQADLAVARLVRDAVGGTGAVALALIVSAAALSTLNATIFTGARSIAALGLSLRFAARLDSRTGAGAPSAALAVQAAIALALVVAGGFARDGFEAMVTYTAPVFWLFLLLVGIALMRLRHGPPDRTEPFRAPLYPLLPLAFCASALYLLYASISYSGLGALFGLGVLASGVPLLLMSRRVAPQPRNV